MSDLVTVKYKREPIMLWYSFGSRGSLSSSTSSIVVIIISVDRGLKSSILNFLRMSFVSFACLIRSPRKNCNSHIIDISNSLLMSSAYLATKE
jgi:hypothetical protein